jgi:hypothetical protein
VRLLLRRARGCEPSGPRQARPARPPAAKPPPRGPAPGRAVRPPHFCARRAPQTRHGGRARSAVGVGGGGRGGPAAPAELTPARLRLRPSPSRRRARAVRPIHRPNAGRPAVIRPSRTLGVGLSQPAPLPRLLPPYCGRSAAAAAEAARPRPRRRGEVRESAATARHCSQCSGGLG